MGICSSCLGGSRRKHEDPETSRLLSDDPYRLNYGSRSQNTRSADEVEAENARLREREVLENIAHGMSEDVVDIFTIVPEESSEDVDHDRSGSPPPQTNGYKEDDARAQWMAYRTVKKTHISKISAPMGKWNHEWSDIKAAMG
ncbi:MAG: hypothetical protein LQ338_002975 [Usnochroma carphineum]|nr:MAG: hypothetical protein LQ338_002975 [Usnochroma carphineum]